MRGFLLFIAGFLQPHCVTLWELQEEDVKFLSMDAACACRIFRIYFKTLLTLKATNWTLNVRGCSVKGLIGVFLSAVWFLFPKMSKSSIFIHLFPFFCSFLILCLSLSKGAVQVKLELGHRAQFRKKPTVEGFTHDWMVFVRGPEHSNIQHFVEKVVFHLHESFPKPKRGKTYFTFSFFKRCCLCLMLLWPCCVISVHPAAWKDGWCVICVHLKQLTLMQTA